jgi:GH15 family glucan-1,4-alpha-glucosidase
LPPLRDQWERERDRIAAWIEDHNWSDAKQPFCIPGSEKLDASIALAVRLQFDGEDRLLRTFDAIQRELTTGPYHYRYISVAQDEGCFVACTFWQIEARHLLGQHQQASVAFDTSLRHWMTVLASIWKRPTRMLATTIGDLLQGLTHLAIVHFSS